MRRLLLGAVLMLSAVQVSGMGALQARLKATAALAKDKRPLMEAAGRYMIHAEIPLIFREAGPGWAPLKLRQGVPLNDTGRLRDSVRYRVTGANLTLYTSLVYAPVHQYGATIRPRFAKYLKIPIGGTRYKPDSFRFVKSVTIPARPFLKFTPRALDAISRQWQRMLVSAGTPGGAQA